MDANSIPFEMTAPAVGIKGGSTGTRWPLYFALHLIGVASAVFIVHLDKNSQLQEFLEHVDEYNPVLLVIQAPGAFFMFPGLFVAPYLTWKMRLASRQVPYLALLSAADCGLTIGQFFCLQFMGMCY